MIGIGTLKCLFVCLPRKHNLSHMSFIHNLLYVWRMRNDPHCMGIVMTRLWETLLVMCAAAAIVSISFVVWTVLSPSTGDQGAEGDVKSDSTETISREQLKNVLTMFQDREMKYKKLSSQPPPVVDPSSK